MIALQPYTLGLPSIFPATLVWDNWIHYDVLAVVVLEKFELPGRVFTGKLYISDTFVPGIGPMNRSVHCISAILHVLPRYIWNSSGAGIVRVSFTVFNKASTIVTLKSKDAFCDDR